MTQNQIAYYNAQETQRHNQTMEQLQSAQTAEAVRHNVQQERLSAQSNAISEKHYERADTAGMTSAQASIISANASALNAETNRSKYKMEYDIEYGWTGNTGYPQGMPLSAQRKSAELELLTLDEYSKMPAVQLAREKEQAEISQKKAQAANYSSGAMSNILNSIFGKQGVTKTIVDLTEGG